MKTPIFPDGEWLAGKEGAFRVQLMIDKSGNVTEAAPLAEIKVGELSATFPAKGKLAPPGFYESIQEAAMQWKFEPARKDGVAVESAVMVIVNYQG